MTAHSGRIYLFPRRPYPPRGDSWQAMEDALRPNVDRQRPQVPSRRRGERGT